MPVGEALRLFRCIGQHSFAFIAERKVD